LTDCMAVWMVRGTNEFSRNGEESARSQAGLDQPWT
jgi:hypothetical protein